MILDVRGNPMEQTTPQVESKKPDLREVAVVSIRDKFSSYPSQGLTPEKLARILKEADQGDVYRQMELFEEIEEKDPHLMSLMQTRKNTLLGLDWEVIPYSDDKKDQDIAQFVGDILYNMEDIEDVFLDLLDAVGKGFACSEIMWEIINKKAIPTSVKWRHQKKFRFDEYDNLRLLTDENMATGIELPANKFLIHQYKARSGHPSRAGVYRVCTWMYLFKNYTLKDWIAFAEVYGMPIRIGKYESGTSSEDKEALINAVIQIGTDAAGIISKSTEIEFVEAMKADGTIFENLARFCNTEMSKAILGQTLSSDIGAGGSYAASKTHAEVRQDILEGDCKGLAKTIRRDIIRPIILFNFGDASRMPYLKFHYEKPEDQEKEASKYKTLVDMGLPISSEHVYEKFGIPKPLQGQEVLKPPGKSTPNFLPNKRLLALESALPYQEDDGQRTIDTMADACLSKTDAAIQSIIKQLLAGIGQATSLEEVREKLLQTFGEIDTEELDDLMAKSIFVTDLYGRWTAGGN